jgi:16S rRNA (guanine527-N7)-methyltransferase
MEKFVQELYALTGLKLSARQVGAFECYERELLAWNEKFNLTAIRDSEGIRTKHFLDSLSCYLVMRDRPPARLVDVGTGAGFPGIPLKIIFPAMQLTLVESVGKKAEFCRNIVQTLKLERVEVLAMRAEDLGILKAHREKYDWAVARAVAALPVLAEFLVPLVKIGGSILAQKGESGPAEAHSAERAFQVLGGNLRQIHRLNLPGVVEDRFLIVAEKVAATPPGYPRRVGLPAKRPIA